VNGWRTIESAPRDGTRVLVLIPPGADGRRSVEIAAWDDERFNKRPPTVLGVGAAVPRSRDDEGHAAHALAAATEYGGFAMTDDLHDLDTLAAEATPGPWHASKSGVWSDETHDAIVSATDDGRPYGLHSAVLEIEPANAIYIAAANPTRIRALIAEVRAKTLALRNVRAMAKRLHRTDPENAAHLLRFCDEAGVIDRFLRVEEP
jgi:hypothetical protein